MNIYQVIISNIGIVHEGTRKETAEREFRDYCELSKTGKGRASDESVSLFMNGEPIEEFFPDNQSE